MRLKVIGRFALGLAISGVFIWLALRDKDLGALGDAFVDADYRYLGPYLVILTIIHLLRTVRWGILLEPLGHVPFRPLNRACAIGFMALVTLPFRLGEFARPYLVSTRNRARTDDMPDIRMSQATGSVVVERLTDGLTMGAVLVGGLMFTVNGEMGEELEYVKAGAWGLMIFFTAALIGILVIYRLKERAVSLTRTLVGPVSPKLAESAAHLVESFIHGLGQIPGPKRFSLFVFLTFCFWGINGVGLWIMGFAFGLDVPLAGMYAVLGAQVIGVMIPAGPGMLGTFQFFTLLGLSLYVPKEALDAGGAAYANVVWAAQFLQQVGFGLVFLLAGHMSLSNIMDESAAAGEAAEAEVGEAAD